MARRQLTDAQRFFVPRCVALLLVAAFGGDAVAQQVNVGVPFRGIGHSFHEGVNLSWGLRTPGAFFQFNAPAPPPFGGFDPNAQATIGGAAGGGFFRLSAGQGANSTFGGQTVSGNMIDGSTLVVGDASLRPFVTGMIPVVASDPSPLREKLRRRALESLSNESSESSVTRVTSGHAESKQESVRARSSAATSDLSVAAICSQQAAEDAILKQELQDILAKARLARSQGKPSVSRIYFQQALRRLSGRHAAEVEKELAGLGAAP